MDKLIDLEGKHILITGASSGIGRETTLHLSRLGAKVSVVARRENELKNLCETLSGEGHRYFRFDLTDISGIPPLVKDIVAGGGPLDGFVHCAGITVNRPLKMFSFADEHKVMLVNYYSFVEISKIISRRGNFNRGMSIVAISSISSVLCRQGQLTYSSSKAALNAAVKCMALELSEKGIRVNAILPAMIKTAMYEEHKERYDRDDDFFKKGGAMGAGEPLDVANMVAFLLSDMARFVTRDEIELTGGYYGQL
ncbi:MAG: SDR family oxidoreductase [Synergistes jonesii]|uniref:SDR family NAD(P)-dependent oxidoreductase n=1 Tax=Synergistes jonesii TaxID=2754 RepID=UPI002A75933D|nr:SDR family oxidoreductase [Synergistes jonesii]MDY2984831.1 SDR family oxidoreductase [Synergistes jonesii]